MRIAVAHEWLTNWAGSERVAEQLVAVSRAKQLVAAIVDPDLARTRFPSISVRALWPSRLPAATRHWTRYALPMAAAWSRVRIDADALLVSSHFAAHGAAIHFAGPSIVYYHTPARLLWRPDIELERLHRGARVTFERTLPLLRDWDRRVAQHATVVLSNSNAVADRVRSAYGRESEVLHPPVDVQDWLTVPRKEPRHLLMFGRLVAYKKPAVAIEAAGRVGVPLLVIGDGPQRKSLEASAPDNVKFLGHAPVGVVRNALQHAHAIIFPGEEDFGIAPVEALASGVPVVAFAAGGALDYVVDKKNGLLVHSQDEESFAAAMNEVVDIDWDTDVIRETSLPFDIPVFRRGLSTILDGAVGSGWRER
jgi:glycosyltransferase involved in cell wall biosynthesis